MLNFAILLSVFSRFTRIFSSLAHYFYINMLAGEYNFFWLVFPLLEKATISQQHEGNENSVQKTKIYLSWEENIFFLLFSSSSFSILKICFSFPWRKFSCALVVNIRTQPTHLWVERYLRGDIYFIYFWEVYRRIFPFSGSIFFSLLPREFHSRTFFFHEKKINIFYPSYLFFIIISQEHRRERNIELIHGEDVDEWTIVI